MNNVLKSFDLTGRRALVTGSSTGIGFALARGLGGAGARVILNGRNEARLQDAVRMLREEGIEADAVGFDATSPADVSDAIERIETQIGPIDILVNNAGMQRRAPLEDFSHEQWQELMRTNVDSVFLVGKTVARHMIGRGAGKIIMWRTSSAPRFFSRAMRRSS